MFLTSFFHFDGGLADQAFAVRLDPVLLLITANHLLQISS